MLTSQGKQKMKEMIIDDNNWWEMLLVVIVAQVEGRKTTFHLEAEAEARVRILPQVLICAPGNFAWQIQIRQF